MSDHEHRLSDLIRKLQSLQSRSPQDAALIDETIATIMGLWGEVFAARTLLRQISNDVDAVKDWLGDKS